MIQIERQAPELDAVSRAYILASLALGEHFEGLIDSYYGPEDLREQALATADLPRLVDDLERAIADLESGKRKRYLETQATAIRTLLRKQRGDDVAYLEEVTGLYDIIPEMVPEQSFEEAHRTLDELLPGAGDLTERLASYRSKFELDPDTIKPLADYLASELRARTSQIVTLPAGESADIVLVNNQPWSGYNWYLGDLQSRIEINTDLPVRANALPDLVAHEIYCGHHTEHALKEAHRYRELGHGEASVALLTSAQAVISEGIATSAFDVLIEPEIREDWLREYCYIPARLRSVDVERDLEISKASQHLRQVSDNVALLVHAEGMAEDDALSYMLEHGLGTREEAVQRMQFITNPAYRSYIFTYSMGRHLVDGMLAAADDQREAFKSLLIDPWTPTMLREAASA